MDTAGILRNSNNAAQPLWELTWHRIGTFLPNLMRELFPEPVQASLSNGELPSSTPVQAQPGEEVAAVAGSEVVASTQQRQSQELQEQPTVLPQETVAAPKIPQLVQPAACPETAAAIAAKPGIVHDLVR